MQSMWRVVTSKCIYHTSKTAGGQFKIRLVLTQSGIKARLRDEVHKTVPVHYANSFNLYRFFVRESLGRLFDIILFLASHKKVESKRYFASETSLAVFSVFTKCFSWAYVSRR